MAKSVLVTGGAGFIGSHIVEDLLARGLEVAVLDNLATGKRENVPKGVPFFRVDLRDKEGVERAFREFRPTHVSHQAAQASVKVSVEDPVLDFEVNLLGGLNLLEACRQYGVEKLVFASTGGAIYGEVPEGERAEETWPPRPKSPYAASKAAFEHYLSVYGQSYGLKWVSLRYGNVYGPRQDPHGEAGVVAIFAERESNAAYFLQEQDMTRYDAVNFIAHGVAKDPAYGEHRPVKGANEDEAQAQPGQAPEAEQKDSALAKYCVDLNVKANKGDVDPLIGREAEVERCIQVLCRRRKNNPLLVGDPGVGKTAIAEGLALAICAASSRASVSGSAETLVTIPKTCASLPSNIRAE